MPARSWALDARAAAGVTALAVALVLAAGGIGGRMSGGDLHGLHVAKYQEAARAYASGRLPLWNPWEFCGNALLGSGQGGVLYPFAWPVFGVLPPWPALQAFWTLHVFGLAWGTIAYLGMHAIGRPAAALAVLVTLGGLFTGGAAAGIDHPSFLASLVWLPPMLLCWERAVRDGARPWLGWFGLAAGMQWLAAYPDFPIDTAVLLGLVALIAPYGSLGRRLALLAAGMALGVLIGAPQILTLAETVHESPRGQDPWYFAVLRSGYAVQSAGWLVWWLDMRHGVAAMLLAVAGIVLGVLRVARDRLAWTAALVWALFALTPPFDLLYRLPPFSDVRNPAAWGHLGPFFMGALAAAGLTAALAARARAVRAVAVVLALVAAGHAARTLTLAPRAMPFAGVDYAGEAARAAAVRALLDAHPEAPRVILGRDAEGGLLRHRLRSAAGYDPSLPPARVVRLLEVLQLKEGAWPREHVQAAMAAHPHVAALLGVGLVVVPRGPTPLDAAGFAVAGDVSPITVARVRPAVPRARVVHRLVEASDDDDAFRRTIAPERDVAGTAVVASAEAPRVAVPPPGATETVRIVDDRPERVVVEATLAADGLLVLGDTFYPGWTATVDGAPAPIVRADYAFRGVALPAGRHEVRFRYAPLSALGGLAAAAIGTLAALVLAWRRA